MGFIGEPFASFVPRLSETGSPALQHPECVSPLLVFAGLEWALASDAWSAASNSFLSWSKISSANFQRLQLLQAFGSDPY